MAIGLKETVTVGDSVEVLLTWIDRDVTSMST